MLNKAHIFPYAIKDRRKAQRYSVYKPCTVQCSELEDSTVSALIIDLSIKGIFFKTDQPWFLNALRRGCFVEITIDQMKKISGKVEHCNKDGFGISLHCNELAVISLCIDINETSDPASASI